MGKKRHSVYANFKPALPFPDFITKEIIMSRLHLAIAVLFGTLLSAMIYISSQAQETTIVTTPPVASESVVMTSPSTGSVIVTPVPAPKEVVVTPEGYANCFTVDAGWYNNTWIPQHKVCQYGASQTQGVAWVEGYWACNTYTNQECTNWEWKPGRWAKTLEVY